MKLFPLILIYFILEIAVWIGVAQFISGWYVFFSFFITFFIGLSMIRSSTATIMPQMQQMQMTGQMGMDADVSKKLTVAISGFLLMIPGLITDALAIIILIPGVQKLARNFAMNMIAKRQQAMMNKMMGGSMGDMGGQAGQNPFADLMRQMQDMQNQQGGGQYRDSSIIDGEAREVEPERKQIELKDVNQK
ncbi:FxsA family protein [Acinetobacter gerneri]|uniref:FxsA family protein n=1 Tax=Acinetobacter gerneri TaxID=202952 RepID=UPI0032157A3A